MKVDADRITKAMSDAVDRVRPASDGFVETAARRVLERTEW
jgi:hypothetical protein